MSLYNDKGLNSSTRYDIWNIYAVSIGGTSLYKENINRCLGRNTQQYNNIKRLKYPFNTLTLANQI